MSAPAVVLPRPSLQSERGPVDDVLSLGQLLDLCTVDDDLAEPVSPPGRGRACGRRARRRPGRPAARAAAGLVGARGRLGLRPAGRLAGLVTISTSAPAQGLGRT